MEREHLTAGESGCPAKSGPKKLGRAAAYNTRYDFEWCSKYPVKASSSQTYFAYVACSL